MTIYTFNQKNKKMENKIFKQFSTETIGTILKLSNDQQYLTMLKQKKSFQNIANEARGYGDDGQKVDVNRQEYAKKRIMLGEVKIQSTEEMVYDRVNTYMTVFNSTEKYEKEFECPVKGQYLLSLLLLKWIAKKQIITQDTVVIKNSDLKRIGLTITIDQLYKYFINSFGQLDQNFSNTEFVKLKLEGNNLICLAGGRAMKTDSGPGYINLAFAGKAVDMIKNLLEDLSNTSIQLKIKETE